MPKTRTRKLFTDANTKVKNTIVWVEVPRGQGHVLDESISGRVIIIIMKQKTENAHSKKNLSATETQQILQQSINHLN